MKQGKNVQFFYELHRNPPGLVGRFPDGTSYRSLLDGRTFFLLNGQYEVPVAGCPFPYQLFSANVIAWAFRNRKMVINSAFLIAVLLVTQFFIWQLPGDQMDEAKLSFIALCSFALNGVLLLAFCGITLAFFFWNFGKGIILQREKEEVLQLADGRIEILPDLIVMSEAWNENPVALADRIEVARAGQTSGQWVVVLAYQHSTGLVIFSSDDPDNEEFDGYRFHRTEWGEAHAAAKCSDYESESWAQYLAYCRQFAVDFSAWSADEKPRHMDPVKALMQRLRAAGTKAVSMLLILLTACTLASAQKSAQVSAYLGQYRYDNVKPEGEVKFVFEKAVLKRAGHADKTYRELLRDGLSYTDADNAGRLVGITVKGQKIDSESESANGQRVEKADKNEKMVSSMASNEARPIPDTWSIPDSLESERKLDAAKEEVTRWKAKAWKAIRPYWRFVMWFFTNCVLPVLIGVGGFLWYIGGSAAGDSAVNLYGNAIFGKLMVRAHQNAAGALIVIVWITAGVVLANSFMYLIWYEFSWMAIIPIWAFELWAAKRLTNWIVPNMRVIKEGGQGVSRFPQIGG